MPTSVRQVIVDPNLALTPTINLFTTWDTVSSTFAADQSEHFNNLFRPKEPLILYKSDFQLYSHEYLSILWNILGLVGFWFSLSDQLLPIFLTSPPKSKIGFSRITLWFLTSLTSTVPLLKHTARQTKRIIKLRETTMFKGKISVFLSSDTQLIC